MTASVPTEPSGMLVKLRLQRFGRKKLPFYRIVASPSAVKRDGRFLEIVGLYRPTLKDTEEHVKLDQVKIKHWLDRGAQPTETVKKLLSKIGLWENFTKEKQKKLIRKVKNSNKKSKKGASKFKKKP